MKKYNKYIILISCLLVISLNARPWRPGQIPNGNKFSCATCHVDPNGGGTRNQFGQEVEKHVTVGGTEEFWNSALALLDSDGDGKKNGEELQDPTGAWRSGQPNPGNFSLVTNPGDASSRLTLDNFNAIPKSFRLENNYPNPFNPATIINYSLPKATLVTLHVYNMLGQEIVKLVDHELKAAGNYKITFNGERLPSGTYLYRIDTAEYVETKKMILLK